jgi:hypothetical protein
METRVSFLAEGRVPVRRYSFVRSVEGSSGNTIHRISVQVKGSQREKAYVGMKHGRRRGEQRGLSWAFDSM